jgi:hypothetical protein
MICVSFSIDKNMSNLLYILYIYNNCRFLDTKLLAVYTYFLNDLLLIILITNNNNI